MQPLAAKTAGLLGDCIQQQGFLRPGSKFNEIQGSSMRNQHEHPLAQRIYNQTRVARMVLL